MITAKTLTNGTLTVVVDGSEVYTARSDRPKWNEIFVAFKAGNDKLLLALMSMKAVVENYTVGHLSVDGTGVTYNGSPIHTVDADRVMAFLREGLPYQPIANYMARCRKNQSARAITELYPFLEHRNMPLTPEGFIIAYKAVQSNFYSIKGNKTTVVLQGKTNEEGHILNEIGATIEIERSSCDDNFRNGCSFGLHAGSLAYAMSWGSRVILILIDPADVVSIPEDCNCQKLRCCKYKVLGEYTGPMPDTYTSEFSPTKDGELKPMDSGGGSDECPECGMDTCDGNCNCTCGGTDCPNCGCNCDQCQGSDPAPLTVQPVLPEKSEIEFQSDDVTRRVLAIIIEQLVLSDKTPITPMTTIFSLGADSLDGVELAITLEDEFRLEIPDEEWEKLGGDNTVYDVVTFIKRKVAQTPSVPAAVVQDTDDDETSYLEGMQKGVSDRALGKQAQFLNGDQEAADSPRHARFIDGYVCGYA